MKRKRKECTHKFFPRLIVYGCRFCLKCNRDIPITKKGKP